jgi:ABC-type enterochelin transport system substrate-binding protein
VKKAKSIKMVVVVDWPSLDAVRGLGIKSTLNILSKLINNLSEV